MRKFILLNFVILSSLLFKCNSNNKTPLQWEGITDNTFRVTISEFFPFTEETGNKETATQLAESLNRRASLLLASYISLNLDRNKISGKTDKLLNNGINQTIANGNLAGYNCHENNYCTAYSDYDISELKKILGEINKTD